MSKPETALRAAFDKAQYEGQRGALYLRACDMLKIAKLDIAQCHALLDRAYADMSGKSLPGEGREALENHHDDAQSRQSIEGDAGQTEDDSQVCFAPSPSPQNDSGGQSCSDTQLGRATAVVPRPAAPSNLVPVTGHLRTKPNAPRGMDAIAAVQGIMAKAIVFRLTDGRDIMEAQFHELAKIERKGVKNARTYTREAMVARYLLAHVSYANPDPFAKVGDLFPPKTIELAVSEADKGMTDAA